MKSFMPSLKLINYYSIDLKLFVLVNCSRFRIILLFVTLLAGSFSSFGNILIGSWNLENFGDKKSDESIEIIAEAIKDLDVIALQEVLVSKGGAAAVARLADALNRKGYKWNYIISDATTSDNLQERERYAFLWKPAKIKLIGKACLAAKFEEEMCREPFMATFEEAGKRFTLINFHAVPKKKQPETEIKYLKLFKDSFQLENMIFLGDFNCPQSHTVFNPLKNKRYRTALAGQKTTLKQECKEGECLASEYDNILYPQANFSRKRSGIIPFYLQFKGDMAAARKVSDHLPIFVSLE
jgi:endonuclease/exonuclease/phosphatase family metal-dependent hydrolase